MAWLIIGGSPLSLLFGGMLGDLLHWRIETCLDDHPYCNIWHGNRLS
jgi:hypothetical protein